MDFPVKVQSSFGYRLHLVQTGDHPPGAKPLKGYRGVLELIEDFDGDTFRTVCTVRFKEAVYVLHAFKKKSKRGIATPKADLELIERRLRAVTTEHETKFG